MGKRKTLKPSLRFEVFKRDRFTCQYCGKAAPDVVLHVDHMHPVSDGGADDILNLITSCIDCNLGKGARLLSDDTTLAKQRDQLAQLQERREQLDMLVQWKSELVNLDGEATEKVARFYSERVPGWHLNDNGKSELRQFIAKHGVADVMDAITVSATKLAKVGADGNVTRESALELWPYVSRVLAVKASEKRNPGMGDLFYARGIARKRCGSSFKDWDALDYLKQAHKLGADGEALKDIARSCTSWSNWRDTMLSLIEQLEGDF